MAQTGRNQWRNQVDHLFSAKTVNGRDHKRGRVAVQLPYRALARKD